MYIYTLQYISTMYLYTLGCSSTVYYMNTLHYISTIYTLDCSSAMFEYKLVCSSMYLYTSVVVPCLSTNSCSTMYVYTLECSSTMFEYKLGCSTMFVYTLQYSYNTYVLTLGVRVLNGVLPHPIRVYELS